MKTKADSFACRGILIKEVFHTWRSRADKSAWVRACEQSEEYRHKVSSTPVSSPEKKRKISNVERGEGSIEQERVWKQKKKARRRISNEYHAPQNDEELAARFMEVRGHCCVYLYTLIMFVF
jgi:nuclear mRNA export protein SAC3